ncbi:hypothetical protein SORBI_3009G025950 [Sorghum bicolor]|uniref:Uncharacterized protein n=1 Tax=Sorghum bicolor TaxID=4558 RepID=A0A1Z5R0I6_SORBI|nr:hypothetical protein SORBI_3009G025950 [Sorghum bicolor]
MLLQSALCPIFRPKQGLRLTRLRATANRSCLRRLLRAGVPKRDRRYKEAPSTPLIIAFS